MLFSVTARISRKHCCIDSVTDTSILLQEDEKSAKKKAVAAGLSGGEGEKTLEELQAEEEVTRI